MDIYPLESTLELSSSMDSDELTPILSPGSPDYSAPGVVSDEHSSEEDSSGITTNASVSTVNSSVSKTTSEDSTSMVSGCLRGTSLFLTFPQCSSDPKRTLEEIVSMFDPKFAVVAPELHKDGTPHLHIVIKLKKRRMISFKTLDKITGKRGNYQNARNIDKCLKYVSKDGEWHQYEIDLLDYLKNIKENKSTKATVAMNMVREGKSLDDLIEEMPGFAFTNKRKIEGWIDYFELKKYKKEKLEWTHALQVLALSPLIDTPNGQLICSWLYSNINRPRSFKQKQLMIHGVPNLGKTSLIHFLEKHLKIYYMTHNEYDDNWQNNHYQLAVMDEFRGQKPIVYWNRWLQGGTMTLKVRYRAPNKEGNIPTIILGNFDLQACYSNCDYTRIAPMEERLEIIEITEYLEINQ